MDFTSVNFIFLKNTYLYLAATLRTNDYSNMLIYNYLITMLKNKAVIIQSFSLVSKKLRIFILH